MKVGYEWIIGVTEQTDWWPQSMDPSKASIYNMGYSSQNIINSGQNETLEFDNYWELLHL